MPATSRKSLESPAVAAGTLSVNENLATEPASTQSVLVERLTDAFEPEAFVAETLKRSALVPKFFTRMVFVFWKSRVNSATPKLRLATPGASSSMAMAEVREAGSGCARPDPPWRTV